MKVRHWFDDCRLSRFFCVFFLHQMQHLSCVCYERCVCDLKVVSDVNAVGDTGAVGDPAAVGDNCRLQLLTLRNSWLCMGRQCPLFSDVVRLGAFFNDVFRWDTIVDIFQGDVIVDVSFLCLLCGGNRNASCSQSSRPRPWISPSEQVNKKEKVNEKEKMLSVGS